MIIVRFEPHHLDRLDIQSKQIGARDILQKDPTYIHSLTASGEAWTALVNGVPMCCAGVADFGDGRGYAWGLFAEHSGRHFVALFRSIVRGISLMKYRRIEATADCRFPEAVRLLQMAGFTIEGTMRAYGMNGEDHFMMGRVK